MPYCASCGKGMELGQKFCPNCGKAVRGGGAPTAPAAEKAVKDPDELEYWMTFSWREGILMLKKYLLIRLEPNTPAPMIGIYRSNRDGDPRLPIAKFRQCDLQNYQKVSMRRWDIFSVLAVGCGTLGVVASLIMGAGLAEIGVCTAIAIIGLFMSKGTAIQFNLAGGKSVKVPFLEQLFSDDETVAFLKKIGNLG